MIQIEKNGYTIAEIDTAIDRTSKALTKLPEGVANPAVAQTLIEMYLGASDADQPEVANHKAAKA